MTPELLLEQFDVLSDAPNGVQKLRELILQLAVRGKLVPQDPADEPASVLLEQAKRELAELVQSGGVPKLLPPQPPGESKLFSIPSSWVWARLGDVAAVLDFKRVPVKENERVRRTKGKAVVNLFPYYGATQQVGWIDDYIFDEELVLLGEDGAPFFQPGKNVAYVVDGKSWVNNHAHVLRGLGVSNRYLCAVLNQTDYHRLVTGTTRLKLTQSKMVGLPIPLPPLLEQCRIVGKVDQLTAICADLEERQRSRGELRLRATRASLRKLTSAADHPQLTTEWERISNSFEVLYDIPESVTELRKAILQLAVRGNLVPQDIRDEPASVLLERINAEREHWYGGGKIRKRKQLMHVESKEAPFKVPKGWEWARLGHVVDPKKPISYGVLVPGPEVEDGIPFVRVQDISGHNPTGRPSKSIALDVEEKFARTRLDGGEILLAVVGSIGTVAIAPVEWRGANIARALCRIAPALGIHRDYLALVLRSPQLQSYFVEATRTLAQPTLNVSQLEIALIPVPPEAEQSRIVERVKKLTVLCDQLETKLTSSRLQAGRLATSVVHHLTAA